MKDKYMRRPKEKSVRERKKFFPEKKLGSGLLRGAASGIKNYHKRLKDI